MFLGELGQTSKFGLSLGRVAYFNDFCAQIQLPIKLFVNSIHFTRSFS